MSTPCFLGALEVDAEGNLANWIIPGKKMPGMGGAMDLCVGAKHCIVCMEHTAKGNPKIFEKCRLPLTASHCVNKIITEMCVLEVTDNGLLMTEINPEFTVEQVQAATAAPIKVAAEPEEHGRLTPGFPALKREASLIKAARGFL